MKQQHKNILLLCILFSCILVYTESSAQSVDLDYKLKIHMPMNGNADDISPYHFSTEIIGPVLTYDRYGNENSAYLFDGIDDRIKLNNNNPVISSSDFSISVWAKVNGKSQSINRMNILFEQRDDEADLGIAKATIQFSAEREESVSLQIRSDESSGDFHSYYYPFEHNALWHHYVLVKENLTVNFFIDGKLGYTEYFPETGTYVNSIDHVDLGSQQYKGTLRGAFNGVMDDIYIYDRALNICEILMLYSGTSQEER